MRAEDVKTAIADSLRRIAPEIPLASVDPATSLRDQMDLDSMDFLNFVIGLHERLGIEIPESDYARLVTTNDAVAYLVERTTPSRV